MPMPKVNKMIEVKNTSNDRLCIAGLEVFEPGEVRSLDEETASIVLNNPNFEPFEKVEEKKTAK